MVICQQLMSLFCSESGTTVDVPRATALMVEYAGTLSVESVKACVEVVSNRLAELPRDGRPFQDARLKKILLNLLLFANARDDAMVAHIFGEAMRGSPHDVENFRWCLVNWLADKVVDRWPPLPDELKEPSETERLSDDHVAASGAGNGDTDSAALGGERLQMNPQTQIITLDGKAHQIADPKAFAVYETIACSCPKPLTKAAIQDRVAGCRGDKTIRKLLDGLPKQVRQTILSGPNGYWLRLDPLPTRGKRRRAP
jgi:hypothetical protein